MRPSKQPPIFMEMGITGLALVDATPLQSEHRVRGVGTYVRHLVRFLIEREPDRLTFALTSKPLEGVDDDVRRRGVFGYRAHRPAQVYWLQNELFLRRLKNQSHPSVFHATDFNGLVVDTQVPTVVTLYDLMPLRDPRVPWQSLSQTLSDWRWRVFWRRLRWADHIIALSHSVRDEALALLPLPTDRVSVIYPGVDQSIFRPPSKPDRLPCFFAVGTLERHKNLPRVLDAFSLIHRRHSSARLALAGNWRAHEMTWLERQVRELGIADSTDLLGRISEAELVHRYQTSLAFVFPSLAEGFGFPLVEAMTCGTPVITGVHGAPAEVVGPAGLLVEPEDVREIARAMEAMLTSDTLRERLSHRSQRRAALFTWSRAADETLAVYRALERVRTPCAAMRRRGRNWG